MERQKSFNQPAQRQIHVPKRAENFSVPRREALQTSAVSEQTVVKQTITEARRTVGPGSSIVPPAQSRKIVDNSPMDQSRVTFEQIARANIITPKNPYSPISAAASYGGATAGAMTMPVQNIAMNNPKITQKIADTKTRALNQARVKKSIDSAKQMTTKVKNHPHIKKIQAKMADKSGSRYTDILRYGVVAICLVVAGFLAYDTWQTNRQIQETIAPATVSAAESPAAEVSSDSEDTGDNGYVVAPDMPRTLSIPSIGVAANVVQIGTTGANQVDMPGSVYDAGWYDGSAKPGTNGAAFIAGHYNIGSAGVFNYLANINIGDDVYVELGSGEQITYQVYYKETIAVEATDMNHILSNTGNKKQALNLMTCAGTFNGYQFSHRVVVYTERIS